MNKPQKIALVASLIGILILLFISQTIEPKLVVISNITQENLNQQVKISGKITSLKEYNNQTFQILEFQDETGTIEVTANANKGLKNEINLSRNYELVGKITEYNNTLQISINKLIEI